MKSAYLYIRVSTDEQKRKGFSLPEQEDRLLKYCSYNNIEVKGIFREDFSAKNFNRPEWKKLMNLIKASSKKEFQNILFIKWDRFSRNIEYAYEMIGLLRKYKITPMAIDQPIDLSIPESAVMLAVYLSVPEAENTRRALNTANGIRRAKLMGRYPNKAPLGYSNLTTSDGKKIIVPKQPEADIIQWIFIQIFKNNYSIDEVRNMALEKGLQCSRSYFFRLIRNPVYCGLVSLNINSEEKTLIDGIHQPIIDRNLFNSVQQIITTKRKITSQIDLLKETFFLRGFLVCPTCKRTLSGSFSKGSTKKYPYYHCQGKCKTRINALFLNDSYTKKLNEFTLLDGAAQLFKHILNTNNTNTQKTQYLSMQTTIRKKLREEELLLSQVRKLFVSKILKLDDYNNAKVEYKSNSKLLNRELVQINNRLCEIDKQILINHGSPRRIFQGFSEMSVSDKRHVINLIKPYEVNYFTGDISLKLNNSFSKIFLNTNPSNTNNNELH